MPFVALLFSAMVLFIFAKLNGLKFNYTTSMAIGLYKKTQNETIHRGDLVSVCLPNKISSEGLKKSYLIRGTCPSHAISVLKQVIAVPGDTVTLSKQTIQVHQILYPTPHAAADHHGDSVKQFIDYGHYKNIHKYWLYGSNNPIRSWDSRYYGGVERKNITGIYKPFFIF